MLSACGGGGDDGDDGGAGNSIVFAYEQELASWNKTTSDGNLSANSIPLQWVTMGFWYWGEGGEITPNEDFGSYEMVSEDPLTIEYTIHPDAVWSDGEPIDCDDVLLHWSQNGGYLDWSTPSTTGIEDVMLPDCEPGDKEFTYEYRQPFADWEIQAPGHGNNTMMPAHIVAEQGGLESGDELIDIIKSVDWENEDVREEQAEQANEQLADAIEFFQNGWVISDSLPDEELIPSSGPFITGSYDSGNQLTLVPNEEYWGEPPAADEVIIRFIEQNEQAQALQNGEIDIMAPQPTNDLKDQLEAMEGVQTEVFDQFTFEHITFNHDSGAFADSPELRQAFAMCVPRQLMVENLIHPIQPDAEPRDTATAHHLEDYYDEVVAASLPEEVAAQDVDAARELLEEHDLVGTTVELGTQDNPRRNNQAQLTQDACNEAGFDVQLNVSADFLEGDGDMYGGRFDAAMFAWQGSPAIANWTGTYTTIRECTADGKGNNVGCYSSEETDALINEVLQTADPDEQARLVGEISARLWEDGVSIPLFNHPGMAAWADDVQNVVPNPAQSDMVWNMPEWTRG